MISKVSHTSTAGEFRRRYHANPITLAMISLHDSKAAAAAAATLLVFRIWSKLARGRCSHTEYTVNNLNKIK